MWIVKDKLTHRELWRGAREDCERFAAAFGCAYLECLA